MNSLIPGEKNSFLTCLVTISTNPAQTHQGWALLAVLAWRQMKNSPNNFNFPFFLLNFKISVQGVVALGSHFATLCRKVDFYEAFFFHYWFSKRKGKYFDTFNHSYSKKSSNRATYIAQICYYDPQSAEINVQSPQSATTPKRLTLLNSLNWSPPWFRIVSPLLQTNFQLSCDINFLFKVETVETLALPFFALIVFATDDVNCLL